MAFKIGLRDKATIAPVRLIKAITRTTLYPYYRDFFTTMGSADFSQFVVTTVNVSACETSTLKVRALSPHLSAAFTSTSSNFWASSFLADLPIFPCLICGSCLSDQGFACSFLRIPPHGGHPCCSAMYFVVAYAYSGLSPVRARSWRANQKNAPLKDHFFFAFFVFLLSLILSYFQMHFCMRSQIFDIFHTTPLFYI